MRIFYLPLAILAVCPSAFAFFLPLRAAASDGAMVCWEGDGMCAEGQSCSLTDTSSCARQEIDVSDGCVCVCYEGQCDREIDRWMETFIYVL